MVFKLLSKVGLFETRRSRIFHYFYENIPHEESVGCSGLFFFFSSAEAQMPSQPTEAPYLKNPGIPPFKLLEVDSVPYLTKDVLKKNQLVC